jgi:hypothetical protein
VAAQDFYVSNPDNVDITTNGKTAVANQVTKLSFDNAALVGGWNDLLVFLNAGCACTAASATTDEITEAGDDLGDIHGTRPA